MRYFLIKTYICPVCDAIFDTSAKECHQELVPVTDEAKMTMVELLEESDISAIQETERDNLGRVITVETEAIIYEQVFNQRTGETDVIPVPIVQPKLRPLTTQELEALKLQRDKNLDKLEAIAVKEV